MGTCLDKTHSCIWTIDANCDYKYNQTTSHLSQSVRGEVGYGYRTSFSLSFFPHFSLSTFSINSLHLLSFPAVLYSYSSLSRSLITRSQSSLQIFFLPRFLFPSPFWVSDSCQFFISHSFHMTSPFQPSPHRLATKAIVDIFWAR